MCLRLMKFQYSDNGKLAYDIQADVLCCVVEDLERTADQVFVHAEEGRTVSDCYYKCSDGDSVYSVVYLPELDRDEYHISKEKVLKMSRGQRYDYLWHSDIDGIRVPESQIKIRGE